MQHTKRQRQDNLQSKPRLPLRERNKRDKRRRIKSAARQVFEERDYQDATLRDIAELADVGLATLFLYASDKRDLLFLVWNDDFDALANKAFANIDPSLPLSEQFGLVLRHFFNHHAKNKLLSHAIVREIPFYTSGINNERYLEIEQKCHAGIMQLVICAKEKNEIRADVDEKVVAQMFFYLLGSGVRRWLGSNNAPRKKGIQHIQVMLDLVVSGCASTKAFDKD